MKKFAAAVAASAVAAVGLAVPAQAYDRELYSYAAGHMISFKDIPKSLNAKRGANFNAYDIPGKNYLCGSDTKDVEFSGGQRSYSINYQGRGSSSINVNVSEYGSDSAAENAFNALKKSLKECNGSSSGSQTFDDGSVDTWQKLTTTGRVPMVTVVGVESVFLNENYEDVTTGEYGDRYTSDTYSVYTLVGDVIIQTGYYTGSELNMTAKERRAVNQVAFNAVTRWLD